MGAVLKLGEWCPTGPGLTGVFCEIGLKCVQGTCALKQCVTAGAPSNYLLVAGLFQTSEECWDFMGQNAAYSAFSKTGDTGPIDAPGLVSVATASPAIGTTSGYFSPVISLDGHDVGLSFTQNSAGSFDFDFVGGVPSGKFMLENCDPRSHLLCASAPQNNLHFGLQANSEMCVRYNNKAYYLGQLQC